jgi:hypothetical protein
MNVKLNYLIEQTLDKGDKIGILPGITILGFLLLLIFGRSHSGANIPSSFDISGLPTYFSLAQKRCATNHVRLCEIAYCG